MLAGLAAAVAVTYVLAPTYLWLAIGLVICAGAISAILAFVFQDDTLSLSDAQVLATHIILRMNGSLLVRLLSASRLSASRLSMTAFVSVLLLCLASCLRFSCLLAS